MGPRCEYKDPDGSYLPANQRVLLETASIAGGACVAIIFVFIVLFTMYIFMHKDREKRRLVYYFAKGYEITLSLRKNNGRWVNP